MSSLWSRLGGGTLASTKRAIAELDAKVAERLLADAGRAAVAQKPRPALPALRQLVALALEVATPAAIDLALAWSSIVTLRTKPSARARRALYARIVERLPSLAAADANRVLSWLVMRTTADAGADDATRAVLCAVIDDARIESFTRSIAAEHLARHAFAAAADAAASPARVGAFLEALAARAHLDVVDKWYGVRALLAGDPAQAYEDLAPRYRSRDEPPTSVDDEGRDLPGWPHTWRATIAAMLDGRADPRWVDEAIAVAAHDPAAATTTLGKVATPRAREELVQWAQASVPDERAVFAVRTLAAVRDARAAALAVRCLSHPASDGHNALLVHALVQTATADDAADIRALIAERPAYASRFERALDAALTADRP